ncbi:hypothetical protein EJV47_09460 [Hymenobacter gummosus]|uniref:Outer membrane protein beta-barrel domain-containing protein n=1 Tax=Hymenobacter gummosus TaxID=1776032 RepID=A0A3S0JBE7_9BACT|nr:outer membrane beta-barrel protein [Hymenobacter gummosus]RTQ50834.1 hypothetical protein EJV47_09460 [Hymenobacter gummosus]
MRAAIGVLSLCLLPCALRAQSFYLDPSIGLQWSAGVSAAMDAEHLSKQSIKSPTYGLMARVQLDSRWELSTGARMGGASAGFRAHIPSTALRGNSAAFNASDAWSSNVLHVPFQIGYRFGQTSTAGHGLRLALAAGPQLDWQAFDYDPYDGRTQVFSSSSGNRITWRRAQTDSARWGASVYLGAQARYYRRGRERAHLSLYLVWGLTPLSRYRLDYTLNGEAYETQLTARSSALGFALTVPVRVAGRQKAPIQGGE